MNKEAAIYHFTDSSEKRPKTYKDQLVRLKEFAESKGLTVTEVFCDMSLRRSEHPEFDRFLSSADQYEALVVKDFYHISKNTGMCMCIMKELRDRGVTVYSMENGSFDREEAPFDEALTVATYFCHFGAKNEMQEIIPVQNDVLSLFAEKKTAWSVADQYFDESYRQRDGEQQRLMKLLESRDNYDLLLVRNLNDIHWRTAKFCKIRERLQLGIYSLQEGFLPYSEEKGT